jgi:hypothetical protein
VDGETNPMTAAQARRVQRLAEIEMEVATQVAATPGYSGCLGTYTSPEAAEVAMRGHRLFDREAG